MDRWHKSHFLLRLAGATLLCVAGCGGQKCDGTSGLDFAYTSADGLVVTCDCVGPAAAECYSHDVGGVCTKAECAWLSGAPTIRGEAIPADDLAALQDVCASLVNLDGVDTAGADWCDDR